MARVLAGWLFLAAGLQIQASATAASNEMFPALRKRKLAAAQQRTEARQVQVPDQVQEKSVPEVPAVIPAVVDKGANGYPELPGVSQMLSQASHTLKSVSSQASGLQARVMQAQMQSEGRMAKQKAAFDAKLKSQEEGNLKVIDANGKIKAEIKSLQNSNAALKKHAHEIEQTNHVMRTELHTLESHLGVAKEFIAKSLTATDDSKSESLQVLRKGGSHHRALVEVSSSSKRQVDDDDDEDSGEDDEDSDEDEEGISLLSVSMKAHRVSEPATSEFESEAQGPAGPSLEVAAPAVAPSDLLAVLAKDVANLAEQEQASEKNLKQLFIKDFRAGAKRNKALLAQQKKLIATRDSLLQVQAQLKSAEAHVESTRAQLEARLHGLGQYLQKLAHLAMAPQHEVKHLLEVLPKTVTIKAGK